ncbi:hypothetical protein HPP92_004090 [Vanilla planifolia]|uniref:Uncharacterized protein n=1 Tax=Vanilla planifolia TaxID=51239 RepID=A0A835RW94_VANPL|nr:hypothetical protein HPP92_004090 [Vanilla planifolia]
MERQSIRVTHQLHRGGTLQGRKSSLYRRRIQEVLLAVFVMVFGVEEALALKQSRREEKGMGRTWDMEGRCHVHPTHKQMKGVCPFCLRERLAELTANPSTSAASSIVNSSDRSDAASPSQRLLQLLKRKKQPLRRSASLSLSAGDPGEEPNQENKEKKKKLTKSMKAGRLWVKLMLAAEGRREEGKGGLSHSMTVKEKTSSKWTIF